MDTFQNGLSEALQDELARVDRPPTFDALVHLCLQIDARLQRRRPHHAFQETTSMPVQQETAVEWEEPMELGTVRSQVSRIEMDGRRAEGLCFYCGDLGHLEGSCPKKNRGVVRTAAIPQQRTIMSDNQHVCAAMIPRLYKAVTNPSGPHPDRRNRGKGPAGEECVVARQESVELLPDSDGKGSCGLALEEVEDHGQPRSLGNSNVTPVKSDGSVRICADFKCTLNRALQQSAYLVPVVQHLLTSLAQGTIFPKLDLAQAYQQLPVDEATAEVQTIVIGNYSQLDREALAIVAGVKRFHSYLYGCHFHIVTDYKPLLGIIAGDKQTPQILSPRWTVFLAAYDYMLHYRPGKHISQADALSRCLLPIAVKDPVPASTVLLIDDMQLPITAADVARHTSWDKVLAKVLGWTECGWPSYPLGTEWRPFTTRQQELSSQQGCLLWGSRVVIPASLQEAVLTMLHDGHLGIVRMKALGRSYAWWPGMDQDIAWWVASCPQCQETRPACPKAPIQNWEQPRAPWSRIHMDLAGPAKGQMFIVIVDAFSKWVELFLLSATTAPAIIKVLPRVFMTHGLPDLVVSDNGPQFIAAALASFFAQLGVRHAFVAPFNPVANGLAECVVQQEALARFGPLNWQVDIDMYLLWQHATPCTTMNKSPAELLMGRRIRTTLDRLHPEYAPDRPLDSQSQRKGSIDTPVYARNYSGHQLWLPGIVRKITGPCSYLVEDGRVWKRHINQLRNRQGGANLVKQSEGLSDMQEVESQEQATRPWSISLEELEKLIKSPSKDLPVVPCDAPAAPDSERAMSPARASTIPVPPAEGALRKSRRVQRQPSHLKDYACTF
ncbi:PREDICTED: uncharacterized protein K02A2.6-like [Thamnophis sirtalis]|uniref:Gypsy retrotransposon integrase-like protein 1 n=1 Tax=Thamnophis sirtalis TaxID=35019 RepID=A0A6I9X451_9SAUR|nr:PREDICTED: uncharacterized protein K02A2.6-like [Thamnophis sirtalis]